MSANKYTSTIVLFVAIIAVVNLLADQFYLRLDFTEDKQYTLSKATRDILNDLQEPITVKAYFSKDVPAQLIKTKRDFQEMLMEYGKISGHMLVYEFISPNENEDVEMEAQQSGIQPVMINVREKDQMKQQRAYMGAVLNLGDAKEVIPVIEPGLAMEYALTTSIKKLSVTDKPTVGLLQGHGEPGINQLLQVNSELSVLYRFESVYLTDTTTLPERINTLAIVRPTDSIPDYAFHQLDQFLARGGRLFIAMNRVNADLQQAYGEVLNTGLETWLRNKGLIVNDNFILDVNCVNATMQQQIGNAIQISSLAIPYIPILTKFADHPITSGLESVIFQFASTMNFVGDSSISYTPLVFSSDNSGIQPAPQYFNYQYQWTESDFPLQSQVLGCTLEGPLAGNGNSKMVVLTDGDFAVNESNQQQIQPDNISLMVNSIDWLSDDTGLINLRTKGVSSRPIKNMEDSTRAIIKWLNFALPIVLVLIYGFIRYQVRRNQRFLRMESNYS